MSIRTPPERLMVNPRSEGLLQMSNTERDTGPIGALICVLLALVVLLLI